MPAKKKATKKRTAKKKVTSKAIKRPRTLEGHSGAVVAVALTGDGRRAVSASDDGTLKVWDLESGAELGTLAGHSRPVWSVALTGDGQRAVSASEDGTLKVWDLESGAELRTLKGHSGFVRSVALTGDGQRAVSASEDGTLKVWDLSPLAPPEQSMEAEAGEVVEVSDPLLLTYRLVLDQADLFELLESLDGDRVAETLRAIGSNRQGIHPIRKAMNLLEKRHPHSHPNPLWRAWVETTQPSKVSDLRAALKK